MRIAEKWCSRRGLDFEGILDELKCIIPNFGAADRDACN
jgi:hypothetical protein